MEKARTQAFGASTLKDSYIARSKNVISVKLLKQHEKIRKPHVKDYLRTGAGFGMRFNSGLMK